MIKFNNTLVNSKNICTIRESDIQKDDYIKIGYSKTFNWKKFKFEQKKKYYFGYKCSFFECDDIEKYVKDTFDSSFIKDGEVYIKAYVAITMASGKTLTQYFGTNEEKDKYVEFLKNKIN